MKNKLILFLLLFSTLVMAQSKKKKPVKKQSDDKKSEIQVFDDGDDKDYFDAKNRKDLRNTLKFNIPAAIIGDFPVYYERIMTQNLSVEAGVGMTYRSDRVEAATQEVGFTGLNFNEAMVLDNTRIGTYYSFSLRFYPNSRRNTIPEGVYFSLGTRFRQYAYNSHMINDNIPFENRKSSVSHLDLGRLTVGYVGKNDSFIGEYYACFALRQVSINSFWYDPAQNFEVVPFKSVYKTPALIVGIRCGFGW